MSVIRYRALFAGITEPELRRLLMGDKARNISPITGMAYVPKWAWCAVCDIANANDCGVGKVLADSVVAYVKGKGYEPPSRPVQPSPTPTAPDKPNGFLARVSQLSRARWDRLAMGRTRHAGCAR